MRQIFRFLVVFGFALVVSAGYASAGGESPESGEGEPAETPAVSEEQADEPVVNTLKWTTASEVDNFGFDIFRGSSEDGPFERVNETPIAGAGTVDEPAAAPALVRQAAFVPTDQSQIQQVVPMRGSMTDELTDEEEALIATLLPSAQPRQLTSSQLARLARQTVDRNGKGPLLMFSTAGGMEIDPSAVAEMKVSKMGAVQAMQRCVEEIHETGCLLKDLDEGLLDFPAMLGDREVYLCWKLGEDEIAKACLVSHKGQVWSGGQPAGGGAA